MRRTHFLATLGLILAACGQPAGVSDPQPNTSPTSTSAVGASTTVGSAEVSTTFAGNEISSTTTTTPSSDPDEPRTSVETSREPTVEVGPPSVEGGVDGSSFADEASVEPGVVLVPIEAHQPSGSDSSGLIKDLSDTPTELAPERSFGIGLDVQPDGHWVTFFVGVETGLDGLAELFIEFGDGERFDLSQRDIDSLGERGTVEVVHRYEPTLERRQWQVIANAIDGSGRGSFVPESVTTQAEFLLSYSPLTVQALDACDGEGERGDFTLKWNNDGRERSSRFHLRRGESYVEEQFRTGINDVVPGAFPDATLNVKERDGIELELVGVGAAMARLAHRVPAGVMQLGTHTYDVAVVYLADIEGLAHDDCYVELTFALTFALDERR